MQHNLFKIHNGVAIDKKLIMQIHTKFIIFKFNFKSLSSIFMLICLHIQVFNSTLVSKFDLHINTDINDSLSPT